MDAAASATVIVLCIEDSPLLPVHRHDWRAGGPAAPSRYGSRGGDGVVRGRPNHHEQPLARGGLNGYLTASPSALRLAASMPLANLPRGASNAGSRIFP